MIFNKTCILFLILSFISVGISYSNKIEKGVIIDSVKCAEDSSQSYAVYLPKMYENDTLWPVIYIFDPAARGKIALNHFIKASEKHGYILICSNNSRNGPMDNNVKAANAVFYDSFNKYRIDTNRIYVSGFSGGSRFAAYIALEWKKIKGVIACGAGFPTNTTQNINSTLSFSYVGIVGIKDMNYIEMHMVRDMLNQTKTPNIMLIYEGRHSWPDEDIIVTAIDWLEIEAMNKGYIEIDDELVKVLFNKLNSLANNNKESDEVYSHYIYSSIKSNFKNIHPIKQIDELLTNYENDKKFDRMVKKKEQSINKELESYKMYDIRFPLSSVELNDSGFIAWWQTEMFNINRNLKSKNIQKVNYAERKLNKLTVMCYEKATNYKSMMDFNNFVMLHNFWIKILPKSIYPHLELAQYYASLKDADSTIHHINKAIKNGYTDFDSINNNKNFSFILDKIKSMN